MIKDNKNKITDPTTLIIFGATGDLTRRKLAKALLNLYCKGFMPDKLQIIGVSRRDYSDQQFRDFLMEESLKASSGEFSGEDINNFLKHVFYQQGMFEDIKAYDAIKKKLDNNDNELNVCSNKLYYLAVPPKYYRGIFNNLASSKLNIPCSDETGWTRLLVEKPFGRGIKTARELDMMLGKLFKEEQIFRIDHYLAKDTIQNIIFFRFSNMIFEPGWNNGYIEKVEIKLLEDLDIGTRGSFYDSIGALRDVGQNHMLQMLALIAMDNPGNPGEGMMREKRADVFRSLRPIDSVELIQNNVVRGQYSGYRDTANIDPESQTETYFKIKAFIDNKRWKNIPFYLESGKALKKKETEILIYYQDVKRCACTEDHSKHKHQNILNIKIFPEEGILIRFWAKKLGLLGETEPRDLEFSFKRDPDNNAGEYDKVLLDCLRGDQTLFTSTDEAYLSWEFITPIIQNWKHTKLNKYSRGSLGPEIDI